MTRGSPGSEPALRVASYNLRDLQDDVAAAVRVVRAIGPDVLLVQEIPRQRVLHRRVRAFAAAAGLSWAGGSRGSGGTTILTGSTVRVVAIEHHRLPVPFLQRERGWARASIVAADGGAALTAVSIHLGLDPAQRLDHARRVLAALPAPDAGVPVVIGGDLNEESDGDAWREIANGRVRVSDDHPTFPSVRPRRTIDAIFATTDLRPATGDPPRPAEADLRAATDHRPIWADLRLPRR